MKFLAIKDFATFQHYRDRNPPWIKLYGTLLSDAAFLQMPEAAQAQLMKLWILASQIGHPMPNNPKLLAGRIGVIGKFHLATMVEAGFIVLKQDNASTLLADSEQKATPSVRARGREQSTEIETALSITPAEAEGEAGLAVLLASDADRVALTAVLSRARSRAACIASLHSMLTGNDPAVVQPTPAQFGHALRDFASNAEGWGAALFRGYLKRASRADERPPPGQGPVYPPRRGGAVQRTIDNGIAALLTTPSPISLVPHD